MRVVYTWNDLMFVLEGGRLVVARIIAAPGADPKLVEPLAYRISLLA